MPYIGLLPFLQRTRFTPNMYLCVSMPYIGLLPFLLEDEYFELAKQYMWQCPTSGFSHFYEGI